MFATGTRAPRPLFRALHGRARRERDAGVAKGLVEPSADGGAAGFGAMGRNLAMISWALATSTEWYIGNGDGLGLGLGLGEERRSERRRERGVVLAREVANRMVATIWREGEKAWWRVWEALDTWRGVG